MLRAVSAAWIAACLCSDALAEPVNCRRALPGHEVLRYERVHDVTLRRVLLGPDAIQFEREDVAQAIDELIVWHPSVDSVCVVLTSYDRNGFECGVAGIAAATGDGAHLLREGACALRFIFTAEGATMQAQSTCGRAQCLRGGSIEDAVFQKK